MAEFISNLVQNSVTGLVSGLVGGAVTTVGGYAGNAVNGVGNLIEGGGRSVGEGYISRSFEGVGQSINAYGTSIRNATAPNAGSAGKSIAVKKVVSTSSPAAKGAIQKTLTGSPAQRALPSTKSMKALPAPAPKGFNPRTGSETSQKSRQAVSPHKSSVSPRQAAIGMKMDSEKKIAPGNRSEVGKKVQVAKKPLASVPSTTPSGKVSISAASRPQSVKPKVAKPSLTYPRPAAAGSETRGIGDINWVTSKSGAAVAKAGSGQIQRLPGPSTVGSRASVKALPLRQAPTRGDPKNTPARTANSVVGAGPSFF